MTIVVRARQHDTLELLCWRHLGTTAGVVEAALELNRSAIFNEADETPTITGTTLHHGQLVILPEPPGQAAPIAATINLWD